VPSRATSLSSPPELPEDPTDKAILHIEACADRGRRVVLGMTVPGTDTVACACIAAAVVMGVGGPIATIYEAQASGFPSSWAAGIAFAQIAAAAIVSLRARWRRR
jgi:hypothetical protein